MVHHAPRSKGCNSTAGSISSVGFHAQHNWYSNPKDYYGRSIIDIIVIKKRVD